MCAVSYHAVPKRERERVCVRDRWKRETERRIEREMMGDNRGEQRENRTVSAACRPNEVRRKEAERGRGEV
eukprot:4379186-Lingulodinium_polyedra.AAC.1